MLRVAIVLGWLLVGATAHANDFATDRRAYANSSIIFCSAKTMGEYPDGKHIYGSATISHQGGKILTEISAESRSIDPLEIEDATTLLPSQLRSIYERKNTQPEVIARGEIPPDMWDQLPEFLDKTIWWIQGVQIEGHSIKMGPTGLRFKSPNEKEEMKRCVTELITKAKKCYKHLPSNTNGDPMSSLQILITDDCR